MFTARYVLDPLCYVNKRQTLEGCDMSRAVSRQLLTAEVRIRTQVSSCEICGGQSGRVTGFSLSTSVSPCPYHSTFALYSSPSTCCSYQKDKRAKPRNLRTKQCSVVTLGALDSKVLSCQAS